MGKEYLIDTNSVIDYLDNKLPEKASKLIDDIDSKISVITRMELLAWAGASSEQTLILSKFRCNGQIGCFLKHLLFKWTKWLVFLLTIFLIKNH